ncbi:MAG: hypothetical protein IT436_10595 [Phycisphaerales bacterium]|nr:hypothetical protein [Phycisphaerales bacterium]
MPSAFLLRAAILPVALLCASAPAQCDRGWLPAAEFPGVDGEVDAISAWDPDGPGPLPALIVIGGSFTSAGGIPAANIAAWDGSQWHALGAGVNDYVLALTPLPSGDLIAAGWFTAAGGAPASRIARWDGAAWHPLGPGLNQGVYALALLPSGDLIAGGAFTAAGPTTTRCIARWSTSAATWSAVGAGFNDVVFALAAGPSGELFAGGWFTLSGGGGVRSIARWTGSAWAPLGSGITSGGVFSLALAPGGDLIVGGDFLSAGGIAANHIARWTPASSAWSALGPGIGDQPDDIVYSLTSRPDGSIVAAGILADDLDTGLDNIASWDGARWSSLDSGITGLAVFSAANLPGGDLAAGGIFSQAGLQPVSSLARWHPSLTLCPADLNCDGMVDFSDYLEFLNLYDAADPRADFNHDGLVDFSDYLEFLNLYDAGC